MEWIVTLLSFLKIATLNTFQLTIRLFGGVFVYGLILYVLARLTRNSFNKSIGSQFDQYFTGWIGTPIHELGHALFCLLFGHKIIAIKLFISKPKDNILGYVNHSYNPRNIWHQIGNFFIGIGPILFGSALLFFLVKYLLTNGNEISSIVINTEISSWFNASGSDLFAATWNVFQLIISKENLMTWQFWVFLYLSISIATHMELSPSDLKGALKGLISIILVLLLISIVLQIVNSPIEFHDKVYELIAFLNSILFLSSLLSLAFFMLSFLLLNLYTILVKRSLFHPFG